MNKLMYLSATLLTILFLFNISMSLTATAQVNPGEDDGDHTCYDTFATCGVNDDCSMLVICEISNEQCPHSRTEVEYGKIQIRVSSVFR